MDFLLTAKRDLDAAKRFFRKVLKDYPLLSPAKIGLSILGHGTANHRGFEAKLWLKKGFSFSGGWTVFCALTDGADVFR